MDNLRTAWGPKPALLGMAGAFAALAATGSAVLARTGDGPGALLVGCLAALLAAGAAYGFVVRPKLTADTEGVTVRTTSGTRQVRWSKVRTRLATNRRLGRDTTTLELEFPAEGGQGIEDSDEPELVVLGQLELGEDPEEVLAQLNRLRGF